MVRGERGIRSRRVVGHRNGPDRNPVWLERTEQLRLGHADRRVMNGEATIGTMTNEPGWQVVHARLGTIKNGLRVFVPLG